MSNPRATGADARVIGVTESTYGTAPTDGYEQLAVKSSDLDKERPLATDDLLGQGRDAIGAYYQRIGVAGNVVIPLDVRSLGFWLHGIFGAATVSNTNATGSLTFSAQPAAGSTITLNGVTWTFVASGATGAQTNIGVDLAATLTALASNLNASANAEVAKVTYVATATALTMTFDATGTTGNSWTLAASATSNATASAETLLGGGYSHRWDAGGAPASKSIQVGHPNLATPVYYLYTGCALGGIAFSLEGDSPANATIPVTAQNRTTRTSSIDASVTTRTLDRFFSSRGSIKVGGTQLAYVTAGSLDFSNSAEAVQTIRSDGLIDGVDYGIARASGSCSLRFSDHASHAALRAAIDAESAVALEYAFSRGDGWSLTWAMPRALFSAAKAPISGPGGIVQQSEWQAEKDSGAGYALRVTLVNDVASYA